MLGKEVCFLCERKPWVWNGWAKGSCDKLIAQVVQGVCFDLTFYRIATNSTKVDAWSGALLSKDVVPSPLGWWNSLARCPNNSGVEITKMISFGKPSCQKNPKVRSKFVVQTINSFGSARGVSEHAKLVRSYLMQIRNRSSLACIMLALQLDRTTRF